MMNVEAASKRAAISAAILLLSVLVLWMSRPQSVKLPVAGGSMVPALNGRHYEVECTDCRYRFACDMEYRPIDSRAVCPNCGFGGNPLSADLAKGGDFALVDRTAFGQRSPRRWEIVAYERDSELEVKRIVALPGEHVAIRDGDIYVNGNILRKSPSEQGNLSNLVHNDRYRPTQSELPPRWRGDRRWAVTESGHRCTPNSGASIDWLTYHNWACMPVQLGVSRTREIPVKDVYAYNQGLSRVPNTVSDLMLSYNMEVFGDGVLACSLHDGRDWLTAKLTWPNRRVEFTQNSRLLGSAELPAKITRLQNRIVFSNFDKQLVLSVNGVTIWDMPYEASNLTWKPTAQPARIGALGTVAEVSELQLHRDVYYFDVGGTSHNWWTGIRLAADEFFVLGDNVPISVDARHWDSGRLHRKSLVGRVLTTSRDPRRSPTSPTP